MIRLMQLLGVLSLFLCVLSMFLLYVESELWGEIVFGISLIALLLSLFVSLREIQLSTRALDIELSDMELGRKLDF